jgi:hypothetical protein
MKKYQAVLKYTGNDGLTKTVPVGGWNSFREASMNDLRKAVDQQDQGVHPEKVQEGWRQSGNSIREKTV